MFNFIGLIPKSYLIAGLFFVIATVGGYIKYLKSSIEDKKIELKTTSLKLDEANKNNVLMYEAYEKTLAIEREMSKQKQQTQKKKEKVILNNKILENEIYKRGELKQDEKNNFTIVTF
uniref:hypothetical protein n=1 Tax=Aliarcobacter sp. TaxID=2321116 RepID=UPI004048848D